MTMGSRPKSKANESGKGLRFWEKTDGSAGSISLSFCLVAKLENGRSHI